MVKERFEKLTRIKVIQLGLIALALPGVQPPMQRCCKKRQQGCVTQPDECDPFPGQHLHHRKIRCEEMPGNNSQSGKEIDPGEEVFAEEPFQRGQGSWRPGIQRRDRHRCANFWSSRSRGLFHFINFSILNPNCIQHVSLLTAGSTRVSLTSALL